MRSDPDTLDLREVGAVLRDGWRWIAGGIVTGVVVAVLVLVFVRPRYESTALVLLRDTQAGGSTALDLFGGGSGSGLGNLTGILGGNPGFDTEVAILGSRSVVGEVVESLGLQADVLTPRGWTGAELFAAAHYPADLEEGVYTFERSGEEYEVRGPGTRTRARVGEAAVVGGAVLTLASGSIPEKFEVELLDFPDAVTKVHRALTIEEAGGSVAEVSFRSPSPDHAAEVPNALLAAYLRRRRTTDRGINQQRYEFLTEHVDSLSRELDLAAASLREHQERSGLIDPEATSVAEVEQMMLLRARGEELGIEARALEQKLRGGSGGPVNAREIAAYPALLENPAINQLLARLTEIDSALTELLERRTEEDPDVLRLAGEARMVEEQIVGMARSYHQSIVQQLEEVNAELAGSRGAIAALPQQVEQSFRLQRDVERLALTLTALQTQLVEVRLAAIAEVGDVRQIDVAEVPKQPVFPRPMLTLAIGLLGGLFMGSVGALTGGSLGSRVKTVGQVERMTGLPAVPFDPPAPLLIAELGDRKSVLVLPVGSGARARPVAERIADTAALRGEQVVLADWTREVRMLPSGSGPAAPVGVEEGSESADTAPGYTLHQAARRDLPATLARAEIEELEASGSFVVSLLPPIRHPISVALLSKGRTAVLVALSGTRRGELEAAASLLKQLGIPLAGVVLHNGNGDGAGAESA